MITSQSQKVDSEETTTSPPLEATELSSVDWATEQSKDIPLSRVIYLLKSKYNPQTSSLKDETTSVTRYMRDWQKLSFSNNILYRTTSIDGQQVRQLVLPMHLRSVVLKLLHNESGHQSCDSTKSLV